MKHVCEIIIVEIYFHKTVEICKSVLLSLDGVNISLNPLLPPRPTAEGDGEEEDDGGEASGHSKE